MASKTLIVTGFVNQDAAIAAAGTVAIAFNVSPTSAGVTTYEVPEGYTLLIQSVLTTNGFGGTLAIEFADDERTYRLPLSSGTGPLLPFIAFESGKRVTATIRNTSGAATTGAANTYGFLAILVPNDYESQNYPPSLPPFIPRPL